MKVVPAYFKSVSLLWIGSIAAAGFALVTQIILARGLGPAEFGQFSSLFTIITIFTPLAGFGAHSLILKVYGNEGWSAKRWLKPIINYSTATSLIVSVLILGIALSNFYKGSASICLLLLLPVISSQAATNLVSSKLQLEERYFALSFWLLAIPLSRLLAAAVLFLFLRDHASTVKLALIYCSIGIASLIISILSLKKMETEDFRLKGHFREEKKASSLEPANARGVAAGSWGFGLSGLLYLIYYQSDIVLLEYLVGGEAAGIYNVAYLIIGATYLLPGVIFQKYLLPQLHRWASKDLFKLADVYKRGTYAMLLLGCFSAICVIFIAPSLVPYIFGQTYKDSVAVLMILAMCVPLRFISSSADAVLTSGKQLNKKIKMQALAAFFNITMNLVFIPLYGLWAAAYITVLSELFMALSMHFYAYKYLEPQIKNRI